MPRDGEVGRSGTRIGDAGAAPCSRADAVAAVGHHAAVPSRFAPTVSPPQRGLDRHGPVALLASVLLHAAAAWFVPWSTAPQASKATPATMTVRLIAAPRVSAVEADAPRMNAVPTAPAVRVVTARRDQVMPAAQVAIVAPSMPSPSAMPPATPAIAAIDGPVVVPGNLVQADGELGAELFERRMRDFPVEVAFPVRLTGTAQAHYPSIAAATGVEGDVVVWGVVDGNGVIEELQVLGGPDALHEAALDAVRRATFRPAAMNGVGVRYPITLQFEFRLPASAARDAVAAASDDAAR